ncbi:MAG: chemotaxis response regulator protein-glutamate methylesterase [Candidatus Margulisbacteria bacterium]|nr:chemotaxis response regulator protein-glutamate methylesterase [Candidatus Margulisiibacteriota bacterium]
MEKEIRLLIVDDSPVVRKILTKALDNKYGIHVVGSAEDPYQARDMIVNLKPDVISLDVEMPKMDGLTFLHKIMTYFPVPTIIVSSITQEGSSNALKALDLGAIAVVAKPDQNSVGDSVIEELIHNIHLASKIDIHQFKKKNAKKQDVIPSKLSYASTPSIPKIIAIASSTGGVEALRVVLPQFPENSPGILVVQHMPPVFTKSLANTLDQICACQVKEAENGDIVKNGHIFIAPGDFHMLLNKSDNGGYFVSLKQGPPVCYQRPAADVLFQSVARAAGKYAVGVVLTGMGSDGTAGSKAMKECGSVIIAQDEPTSVVYGMPKSVFESGVVDNVLPLQDIPKKVLETCAQIRN